MMASEAKTLQPIAQVASVTGDGPLENLLGGGGGRAKYKKNIRARENSTKKNSCTPVNPKKYSCYGLKKIIQGI